MLQASKVVANCDSPSAETVKVNLGLGYRVIDWTLFLNGKDISTKADSHICRCYNTTNNQDIHSEILLQKDMDKYGICKK